MTASELRTWLVKHSLTYSEFAHILGVTDMAVHQWLQGKRSISKPVARLLRLFEKHPGLMKEFGKI